MVQHIYKDSSGVAHVIAGQPNLTENERLNIADVQNKIAKTSIGATGVGGVANFDDTQTKLGTKVGKDSRVLDVRDYTVAGNDRATVQAAVDAAVTLINSTSRGVVVQMPAGLLDFTTAYPSPPSAYSGAKLGVALPVALPARLTIRGQGRGITTVRLSSNSRNAFWINKQADYDVFQNVEFEDFDIDNNDSPGRCHVLIGSWPEYQTTQIRLSFQNIGIRRMRTYGYSQDMTQATQYKGFVMLLGRHSADNEATQTFTKNITCEDITMDDVQQGLLANSSVTYAHNHYYDNINFRRCRHKISTIPASTLQQTSFYVCGSGFGDKTSIVDCYSENIGDDAIEMGPMQDGLIENFTAVNPFLEAILFRQTHPASDQLSQKVTIRDSSIVVTAAPFAVSGITGFRANPVAFTTDTQATAANFGAFHFERVKHVVTGAVASKFARAANVLGFRVTGQIRRVVMNGCSVRYKDFVYDSASSLDYSFYDPNLFPVSLGTSGVNSAAQVVIRDAEAIMENTTNSGGGGQLFLHGCRPAGSRGRVTIDGLNVALLSNTGVNTASLAYAGSTGGTLELLELRRLSGQVLSTSSSRRGVRVASTSAIQALDVDRCDFRQWTTSGTLDVDLSSAGTNAAVTTERNNQYAQKSPVTVTSASMSLAQGIKQVEATGGASGITLTLTVGPTGPDSDVHVAKVDSAVGTVTVAAESGSTINGASTYVISTQNVDVAFRRTSSTTWRAQ